MRQHKIIVRVTLPVWEKLQQYLLPDTDALERIAFAFGTQVNTSEETYLLFSDEPILPADTNLSESIVINMIKYAYEMQENDRWPQAWASRVAGDAATSNQGDP